MEVNVEKQFGAYICNYAGYGYYNKNKGWLEFPSSQKDIKQFLTNINVDLTSIQIIITDYDFPNGDILGIYECLGEFENINNLNLLGKALQICYSKNIFEAVREYINCHGVTNIMEICNLILQSDKIPFYTYSPIESDRNIINSRSKEENFGRTIAEKKGIVKYMLSNNIDNCFDYRLYSNNFIGDYSLCDNGYLDIHKIINLEYYTFEQIEALIDLQINKLKGN